MEPLTENSSDGQHSFTPETLGIRWACSAQHIRDLIAKNKLPSFRVGRLIRVSIEAVRNIECQKSAQNFSEDHGTQFGQIRSAGPKGGRSAPKIVQRPNAG